VLLEKYEIVRAMFRPDTKGGFDYRPALNAAAKPQARLAIMAGAIDWVLTFQQAEAANETSDEGKKRAHQRYADGPQRRRNRLLRRALNGGAAIRRSLPSMSSRSLSA
jgi:hypothetical protein